MLFSRATSLYIELVIVMIYQTQTLVIMLAYGNIVNLLLSLKCFFILPANYINVNAIIMQQFLILTRVEYFVINV